MGGEQFFITSQGKTAKEAFSDAVADAKHNYGHRGYTGTIAEKNSFVEIAVPNNENPKSFAQKLLDEDDPRVDDKFGPAGCVALGDGNFAFFGWASS
jgi:hypothetical protein